MKSRRAWLLNLDADDELADPSHVMSSVMRARIRGLRDKLGELIPKDDVVIDEGVRGDNCRGIAWCPTPRAVYDLEEAGAWFTSPPAIELLRRVNDRAFHCAVFGREFGGRYATSREQLDEALAEMPRPIVLKRAHSFAGRGLLVLTTEALERKDDHWIDAALKLGGIYLEPWHRRLADLAVHGWVGPHSSFLGEPTTQTVHHRGAWRESRRATPDEVSGDDLFALRAIQRRAADALQNAGYTGPFGVDVIRRAETPSLIPCEINARYTMGWAIGMGEARPDLD